MKFRELAQKNIGWLENWGKRDSHVVSTRIRLARNIKDYPFPGTASLQQLKKSMDEVFSACNKISILKNATKITLNNCSDIDRRLLLERHMISHEHSVSSSWGGVIIDKREQISIMVNEEDHLRIQYISGGLNLFDAWDVINMVDNDLSNYLDFAYSDRWGYLTACPTNTGTGMRASCQMHLPGLGMTNGLKNTMENINKMGMVVRGLYGEGTRVMGNMVQISNQVTLGVSEQYILDSLNRLVVQVAERENKVSRKILKDNQEILKDMAHRSRGILSNAYRISFEEAMDLISNVRFGVNMGILDINMRDLNNLMIKIQPAHIQEVDNKKMSASEKNKVRAEIIRKIIG